MTPGLKVAAFAAVLVAAGLVGAGLGTAVGPLGTEAGDHGTGHPDGGGGAPADDGSDGPGDHGDHDDGLPAEPGPPLAAGGAAEGAVGGLSVVDQGYRLDLRTPTVAPGPEVPLALAVLDPAGTPVTEVDVVHERPLHLIVVSRDLVGYHHVHPTLGADGTWTVTVADLAPGSYRVVADLRPTGGPELALGADLTVTGALESVPLPEPSRTATVDRYEVTLDGAPAVGDRDLTFTVRDAGRAVTPDPYLGARGHLVAVRQGDMGYLHVHPVEETGSHVTFGTTFRATFPSAGTYRLFLDVVIDGELHTVAFTVEVPDGTDPGAGHDHGGS